jgi:hypothetical protein
VALISPREFAVVNLADNVAACAIFRSHTSAISPPRRTPAEPRKRSSRIHDGGLDLTNIRSAAALTERTAYAPTRTKNQV